MQMPDVGSLLLVVIMLGLLPFAAMVVTSYTKIVVVLGLLRNAIGCSRCRPTWSSMALHCWCRAL